MIAPASSVAAAALAWTVSAIQPAACGNRDFRADALSHWLVAESNRLLTASAPIEGTLGKNFIRDVFGYNGEIPRSIRFLPDMESHTFGPALIARCGVTPIDDPDYPANWYWSALVYPITCRGGGRTDMSHRVISMDCQKSLSHPVVIACRETSELRFVASLPDALSIHAAAPLASVWCMGTSERMPGVYDLVPEDIETVAIYARGRKSEKNDVEKLAENLRRAGHPAKIRLLEFPESRRGLQ